MAKGNPNPKTEHLKATQYKKGVKRDPRQLSEYVKKYWKEKKDILFYVNEFENKTVDEVEALLKDIKLGKKQGISAGCYVALQLWVRLLKGDPLAFKEYMDRKYGRAKQQVEHTGEIDSNINLNIVSNIQKLLNDSKNE